MPTAYQHGLIVKTTGVNWTGMSRTCRVAGAINLAFDVVKSMNQNWLVRWLPPTHLSTQCPRYAVGVARVLPPEPFDFVAVDFVEHRVIELWQPPPRSGAPCG